MNEGYNELVSRIAGQPEGARVEFKSAEILKNKPNRLLRSVVGMLNAEGGELIVGVGERDGRAASFEGVEEGDRERSRWRDIFLDRIRPQVQIGMALVPIPGSDRSLMVIEVPKGTRGPYAYSSEQSFVVVRRRGDRLRPMTWNEVLEAARGSEVEEARQEKAQATLRERVDEVEKARERRSLWFFIAVPVNELELDDAAVKRALEEPEVTGIRRDGWTFNSLGEVRPCRRGLEKGRGLRADGTVFRHLRVRTNGRVEFMTDMEDFEWGPSTRGGKGGWSLYPYTVTEYPVSLLRFLGYIYQGTSRDQKVLLQSVFFGVKGSTLAPYRPGPPYRYLSRELQPCDEDVLYCPIDPLAPSVRDILEGPDSVALRMIKPLYEEFGYDEEKIPFYERASARFIFS